MFLDRFKIASFTVQIQYPSAFELWDRAGSVAREMLEVWRELQLIEGIPQQQILKCKGVQVQTGFVISSISLSSLESLDKRSIDKIAAAFKIWRDTLSILKLSRLSSRILYVIDYPSLGEANAALRALNVVRAPPEKMFDQPESDLNSLELAYKFEDEKSFSFLRLRTETIKFEIKPDPPFDDLFSEKSISRLVVDFDRGLVGPIDVGKVFMDEWIKGFFHVLRRDIDKLMVP